MSKITKAAAVKRVRSTAPEWFAEASRPEGLDFKAYLRWLKLRCPEIPQFSFDLGTFRGFGEGIRTGSWAKLEVLNQ